MALWGNNDAKGSGGTVSLNYGTLTVTGSGTTFGRVGAAATGDVIRFGTAFGVHYGDAVIVGIASTTQLSIASTAGLSGAAISGVQFEISESPKYAVLDSHLNQSSGSVTESYTSLNTTASLTAGIGTNRVFVASVTGILAGDTLTSGSLSRSVTSIGNTFVSLGSTIVIPFEKSVEFNVIGFIDPPVWLVLSKNDPNFNPLTDPGSPCGPCIPCGPVAPVSPCIPCKPCGPVSPVSPLGPAIPCSP